MTHTITTEFGTRQLAGLPQTPYRALSTLESTELRTLIPTWAEKRSVIRAGHATYYVVETSNIDAAHSDLKALKRLGWIVDVHPLSFNGSARITMNLAEVRQAA